MINIHGLSCGNARCERVMLKHKEKLMFEDWSEYDALLNHNFSFDIATAIEGLVPSGKTYSILSYCERINLKFYSFVQSMHCVAI